MKTPLLIVAVSSMALLLFAQDVSEKKPFDQNITPPAPDNTTPGRFQLVSGVIAPDEDAKQTIPTVFRIDTATGRTWKYQRVNYPVKVPGNTDMKTITTEGWIIITENFTTAIKHSKQFSEELKK